MTKIPIYSNIAYYHNAKRLLYSWPQPPKNQQVKLIIDETECSFVDDIPSNQLQQDPLIIEETVANEELFDLDDIVPSFQQPANHEKTLSPLPRTLPQHQPLTSTLAQNKSNNVSKLNEIIENISSQIGKSGMTRSEIREALVERCAMAKRKNKLTVRKYKRPVDQHKSYMRDVKRLQAITKPLIPCQPFVRLVREVITQVSGKQDFRITGDAVSAIQEVSELYLTSIFEDAYLLSLHAGRQTIKVQDMQLHERLVHFKR